MMNRLQQYHKVISTLFFMLFLSPVAKPQSFDGFQMNLLEEKTKEMIDNYESYFNLIGDITEDWEDRRQHYGRQLINLFSDGAYHYNDLDPTETTSKDFSIEAYPGNIMLFYAQSGISCRLDQNRIAFGTARRHQGNTWTIDAYAEKRLDGLYMGHTLNSRTMVVSFRIAFNFQNNVLKDFFIAGVTVSSRDEMAKDISTTVPRGTSEERISGKQNEPGTFTDPRDSQTYKWVKIGEQVWMAENLAYKPSSGNYWAYNNDQSNVTKYGYLYNWNTARQVCPPGWHLPTDEEWSQLTNYVGSNSGKIIKAKTGWSGGSKANGTDNYGFSAIAGGELTNYGAFHSLRISGYWWSSTKTSINAIRIRRLSNYDDRLKRSIAQGIEGYSVRCVKD